MAKKTLLLFLQEWLAWAEAGAPLGHPRIVHFGLCSNLFYWHQNKFGGGSLEYTDAAISFEDLLSKVNNEGNVLYPFNTSISEYTTECRSGTTHLNPKRVQWVKETIAKLQEQNQ